MSAISRGTKVMRSDPAYLSGHARARLGVLGKGKTGPRAGNLFCPQIDAGDKLLRVPTDMRGRNCTNFPTGGFPYGSPGRPGTGRGQHR